MNSAYSSPNPFPHQPQHGQGINPSALLGQAGGINPAQIMGGGMGGGMGNMNMMGGAGMNPSQLMQGSRNMMNGGLNMMGGGGMGNNALSGSMGMGGSMNGGMGGSMNGMGGGGMGGGGMGGNAMGGSMGGGGMGGGMPNNGMSGGMGNGGGMGMAGMGGGMNTPLPNMMNMHDGMSMQRPGTSMGGVTATSLGGSFGPQFGGSGFGGGGQPPQQMPQQQPVPNAQQLNMILSLTGLSREQYASLNPHDRQIVHERASQKFKERQRMQQEQMMHNMGGGMGGGAPQPPPQQFPGNFGNDRPPSSAPHPSMMPPPPPGIRPGTSMSMRRAPSMEHMRPPSAMGGFPKSSLPEQSPTGNVYPHPSPLSAHRMPASPRMDGGFPPSSASAIGSPTRPVSSASNGPGFGKSGTPARMPSVSRAATATPTNMHSSEPGPHHGTPTNQAPLRSTPTPVPSFAREPTPAGNAPSESNIAPPPPLSAPPSAAPSTSTVSAPPPVIHKLPPLPPNLNKAVTHITPVPLKDSLKLIPEISETEKEQVKDWMKIDKEYEKTYLQMRERMDKEHEAMGKRWWERGVGVSVGLHNILGPPRVRFDVKYPHSRLRKETRGRSRPDRREGLIL